MTNVFAGNVDSGTREEQLREVRSMPQIHGIVESCINVRDLGRARRFYQSLFGFEVMEGDDRFCAFRAGESVLLLFTEGASDEPARIEGGVIPPHESRGAGHFAFSISRDALEPWRVRLRELGIAVESEVQWGRGGRSLYFRDPDKNLVELATPGVWANY